MYFGKRMISKYEFCLWDLYEYPLLQNTTKHSWVSRLRLKTATQLKKLRRVLFALQTAKKNIEATYFDHCKLTNVKLYLNSEFHPYDLNLDFDKYKTAVLYDLYVRFHISYYQILRKNRETLLNKKNFLHGYTHVIIDCSRQIHQERYRAIRI